MTSDLEAEFAPKVVVATTYEDSPEARESRRAAAGVYQVDTATRTIVAPNGSIQFDGDDPGGPPSIWG